MTISQIPTLRAHVWQVRSWWIYAHPHRDLTDSYSKSSYFEDQVLTDLPPSPYSDFTDSYSKRSCLAGQVLTDLPPSPTGISQIPTLRPHIWQTRSWLIFQPPPNSDFTASYSDGSYLAQPGVEVLADLPLWIVISQIPTPRAHIWQPRSWQIYPHPAQGFHRFLL